MSAKFHSGSVVATPTALESVPALDIPKALARHLRGDWGEVDSEDKAENDRALEVGERVLSAYTASNGTRFWIITEADRSVTTVLLPEDY